jgi:hypothetical protein
VYEVDPRVKPEDDREVTPIYFDKSNKKCHNKLISQKRGILCPDKMKLQKKQFVNQP